MFMDRATYGWGLRGVAFALVFVATVVALRAGVDVSARPGLPEAGLPSQLYYGAGLFVLGGLDLGTPTGGPPEMRALLWGAYFSAPLITTSAVVEGALRLVGTRMFDRVGLRDHLLVVGLGQLGTAFVRAIRSNDPERLIVAMDKDVGRAALTQIRRQHRVRVVAGEARLAEAFSGLALTKACGVALLTENDLLNLNTAFRLAVAHPDLPIAAHVSNISLQRVALEMCQELDKSKLAVFNAHRAIAEHLYDNHLAPHFASTRGKDSVVLAGFGRFGQTILELLQQQAQAEVSKLLIADRAAGVSYRAYCAQVTSTVTPEPMTIDGDFGDPAVWMKIREKLGPQEEPPVVIIGSDDDSVNLQGAMSTRVDWPDAQIYVRFSHTTLFTRRLAERYRFVVLGVDTTLVKALAAASKSWFS